MSCGSQSSYTSGILQDRGCKCIQGNNNQSKKSLSEKNRANDSVVSRNDHVGYEVDNTYEPASEQQKDLDVYVTEVHEISQTEDSGVSNNHNLGHQEHGGTGKLNWMPKRAPNLLAQWIIFLVLSILVLSIFLGIKMNVLVVVLDFLWETSRIMGMD